MPSIKCTKTRFSTQEQAMAFIAKIKDKPKREKTPLRSYLCRCGAWHLTSRVSIEELQGENRRLEAENIQLKIDYQKLEEKHKLSTTAVAKEIHKELLKEKQFIQFKAMIKSTGETNKRLRKDNEELIIKLLKHE